ncbi:MAG: hypothetical protein AB7N24_02560 [Dehalococcoidia bacterium]
MSISVPLARRSAGFNLVALVPVISFVAGFAWLAFGFESIVRPGQYDYRNTLIFLPWLPSMAVVYWLHAERPATAGRVRTFGGRLLLAAMAVVVIGQPGIIFDFEPLLAFAIAGFIGFVFGTLAFGLGLYLDRALPAPLALSVMLTQVGTMAMGVALSPWVPLEDDGSYSGAIVHGFVFTALAFWIARDWGRRQRTLKAG